MNKSLSTLINAGLVAATLSGCSLVKEPIQYYRKGHDTAQEIEYNVDLVGDFTQSQISEIYDTIKQVYTKFPKAQEIGIRVEEDPTTKYCAQVLSYKDSLILEDIAYERRNVKTISEVIKFKKKCKGWTTSAFEDTFSNLMFHELGHVLFEQLPFEVKETFNANYWNHREELDQLPGEFEKDLSPYYISEYARYGGLSVNQDLVEAHLHRLNRRAHFEESLYNHIDLHNYVLYSIEEYKTIEESGTVTHKNLSAQSIVELIQEIMVTEEIAENFVMLFNEHNNLHPHVKNKIKELEDLLTEQYSSVSN